MRSRKLSAQLDNEAVCLQHTHYAYISGIAVPSSGPGTAKVALYPCDLPSAKKDSELDLYHADQPGITDDCRLFPPRYLRRRVTIRGRLYYISAI